MIISAYSDTHGKRPPITITGDIILHAGDIYEDDRHIEGVKEWDNISKRILAVRGNHDAFDPIKFFENREFKICQIDEKLWVIGVGFATKDLSYGLYAIPTERTISKIVAKTLEHTIDLIPQGDQTIILSHYAPASELYGSEEGWFFNSITKMCEALKPLALLHGHTHNLFGRNYYIGETPVWSLGPKGFTFTVEGSSIRERKP